MIRNFLLLAIKFEQLFTLGQICDELLVDVVLPLGHEESILADILLAVACYLRTGCDVWCAW